MALAVFPLRGVVSTGSGEGHCHLGLHEHSGTGEEGAVGADSCSGGKVPWEKVNGWDVGVCPIKM